MTLKAADAPVPASPVATPKSTTTDTNGASSSFSSNGSSGSVKKAARVFDVVGHVRSIFNAPSRGDGFAALDGLRGALSVWMVMFHSIAYIAQFYDDDAVTKASHHWSLAPLLIGPLAVDGFFLLTGFLLTYALLDQRTATPVKENPKGAPSFSLRDWYYRRITRMVPLYLLVLIAYCNVFAPGGQYPISSVKSEFQLTMISTTPDIQLWPNGCQLSIFNPLFLNNLLPGGGCLGHTWSLALQFQFYLLVPVLFKLFGRGRSWLYITIAAIITSVVFRVIAFDRIANMNNPIDFFFVAFFWYTNTLTRGNALFMGALLAYLATRTTFVDYLKRAWFLRKLIMIGGVCTLICLVKWSTWFGDGRMLDTPGVTATRHADEGIHHAIYWIFFNVGSPVSATAFGFLILAIVYRVGTFGSIVGTIFSRGFWYPFAQLSFAVYLIHPIVYTLLLPRFFLPELTAFGLWSWAILGAIINFSLAAILFVVVEKPLDIWLRGSEHRWLSWIVFIYCMILAVSSILGSPFFLSGWMSYEGKPEHIGLSRSYLERHPHVATSVMRAFMNNITAAATATGDATA